MPARTILAFAAIYLVWGSTYLAIKHAVAEIPPLLTAGTRHLLAGAVLFAWARYRGLRATPRQWRHSFVVGALFFLVGHGTLHWAEQFVPSGLAALLIATEPISIAILVALAARSVPDLRTCAGLVLGIAGVGLLAGTEDLSAGAVAGAAAVLAGAASWAAGVVYAERAPMPADPVLRTATTLLAGSLLLLAASASSGELAAVGVPSTRALLALAYLVVFGSIVAFTAYYWLLDRYPATLVATHTYVNPIVAVFLGWLGGGEQVTATTLAAMIVIVAAVALVGSGTATRNRIRDTGTPIADARSPGPAPWPISAVGRSPASPRARRA